MSVVGVSVKKKKYQQLRERREQPLHAPDDANLLPHQAPQRVEQLLHVQVITAIVLRLFFFSSRRRHTSCYRDWSSDVCSSDLVISYNPIAGGLLSGKHSRQTA